MISAGELRHRVTIEQPPTGRDADYGSVNASPWTTLATVWASVTEKLETGPSGGERVQQDAARVVTRRTQVLIRYRSDVSTAMRINFVDRANRLLQIVAMAEVGARDGLLLTCEDYSV